MCFVLDRVASEGLRSHNYCHSGSLPKLISNVRGCMLVCCLFAPLFYCFTVFFLFLLLSKLLTGNVLITVVMPAFQKLCICA